MRLDDIKLLACPDCRGALRREGASSKGRLIDLPDGRLRCSRCDAIWRVSAGLAWLYREQAVRGTDRLMRYFYDGLPSLHDPATRWLLPLLQLEGSEEAMREGYMRRLSLETLGARADGQPTRVLEIGIGTGANLKLIERDLPTDLDVEIWGLDLSAGMLEQCQKALAHTKREVRLLLADAHALPFQDQSFDRILHVGALGSFRDPRLALSEMVRVARPGASIVVVDEQLDPTRRHGFYHKLAFRMLTFYDANPHCPRELLPAGVVDVVEEQLSRFYYCLKFCVPEAQGATR